MLEQKSETVLHQNVILIKYSSIKMLCTEHYILLTFLKLLNIFVDFVLLKWLTSFV